MITAREFLRGIGLGAVGLMAGTAASDEGDASF